MRLRHGDGTVVHLAYCTNVHPTEDVEALIDQVGTYGGRIRARLGVDRLGLGLWLPAPVAARLVAHSDLTRLRRVLDDNGLEVVTLNAFPYQGFHDPEVKKAVYHPDWVEPRRLDYTLNCAWILSRLLPDDAARGSISSVPLGWRSPWDADRQRQSREHLDRLADELAKIETETGRTIRVGLEPEPGCVVETGADAVERMAGVDTKHIGVCVDACHLAVQFEQPGTVLGGLAGAGLPVVKAQASAALHVDDPAQPAARSALAAYAEDRFLHQVREPSGDRPGDEIDGRDDLPEALAGHGALPGRQPWRVHFHVPVHERPEPPLTATQDHLNETLGALFGGSHAVTDHLEVETYTWSVLPENRRPEGPDGLADGLAAELRWVADRLTENGLTLTG
ncbi:xylose isomerase-like TIM barrel protein [Haloactinopolyspora alba]|uniref:Xylose isomerase-like TIM barrel protein n=1 Tax=Haloactinopolyspora alba TaxID=648780 RepID=A0A2P8EC32_9ACTN|nr:metabolite traffic protein EboE [Haloactinopolyspora alba]PSL07000.1 xylose isomerase-like TIM barrel protein [Haloactinopolyspora alba]